MRRAFGYLLLATLALASCYGGDEGEAAEECAAEEARAEDPCFYGGRAVLRGDDDSVLIDVEIAESPQQQAMGLMKRESLPEDAGMVFVFFEQTQSGFWMKDTLIPLSIAFFDRDGTILDILDMEPCRSDPCPSYAPDSPYWGALEVNQGAFDEWGISEGDDINVVHNDRDRLFGITPSGV